MVSTLVLEHFPPGEPLKHKINAKNKLNETGGQQANTND